MNDMTGLYILVVSSPYLLFTYLEHVYCILQCVLQTGVLIDLILPQNI